MARYNEIGTADIPGQGTKLRLLQRNEEFVIKIAGNTGELMNSRLHGSEDALATLACERISNRSSVKVLVGGMGMGFTLAAALSSLSDDAEVTVAELVPEVVEWNRGPLGSASSYPLNDSRTNVHLGDVGELIKQAKGSFDAILLDVDNGPEGLTRKENNWIYSEEGLAEAKSALKPGGVLTYWSVSADEEFTKKLKRAGFKVKTEIVRAIRPGKGAKHVIWIAW